jgi:hypothetical protein
VHEVYADKIPTKCRGIVVCSGVQWRERGKEQRRGGERKKIENGDVMHAVCVVCCMYCMHGMRSHSAHRQPHADSHGGEIRKRSQARRDGAFQIVLTEIPIRGGGQE